MWVRFVLVPGLTDDVDNIVGVAKFVKSLKSVEKVEVLPFHQMGQYKREAMGYDYPLKETPTPTPAQVQQAVDIFSKQGLKAH